jgi:DNA-binding response OmpR family regulator
MPLPTVLVVDDDPVILGLLELNLELDGFSVLRAHGSAEGVELARATQPDLVISDVTLRREPELGLVTALKGDEATSAIPVILLSTAELAGHGADDCVRKPFSPLELVDRINFLLAGSANRPR